MLPLLPWQMVELTPDETAQLEALKPAGQETHSSLTEAVRKGW